MAWQDLTPELRAAFQEDAAATLQRDRREWGLEGLAAKLAILERPTEPMRQNIDRVLSIEFASELPRGFSLDRDVTHADLKRAILRVYLDITDARASMLLSHKDFRGWDGAAIREVSYIDHEHEKALRAWAQETERLIASISAALLTPVERALTEKIRYRLRRYQFDVPHVATVGEIAYASLYGLPAALRPFSNDDELLGAYNASMFSQVRNVDRGTIQSFTWNLEAEFDAEWLRGQRLSEPLAAAVLKLGHLYETRVSAHPDATKRCTIYSSRDRAATWNAFTASMLSNLDGSETLEGYAAAYRGLAKVRTEAMRELAKRTLDAVFPPGSRQLSDTQRAQVKQALDSEARPAAMLQTLQRELQNASPAASMHLDMLVKQQPAVGGYEPGAPLRPEDERQVLAMWDKARSYIQGHYKGYPVNIGALLPQRPTITTVADAAVTIGGEVSIGLKKSWPAISLSSTLLHEMKHAIDQRSNNAVEGAAIEGAATMVERTVWPDFVEEAMAAEASGLPLARLITEVDNVRFTPTTDATLQILSRQSCAESEPDTIDFARKIVESYGYTDDATLALRSKRAHNNVQYLSYDYGLVKYTELVEYLQAGVGSNIRVDPFLLQACGMPSAKKIPESIARLRACIAGRKQ